MINVQIRWDTLYSVLRYDIWDIYLLPLFTWSICDKTNQGIRESFEKIHGVFTVLDHFQRAAAKVVPKIATKIQLENPFLSNLGLDWRQIIGIF